MPKNLVRITMFSIIAFIIFLASFSLLIMNRVSASLAELESSLSTMNQSAFTGAEMINQLRKGMRENSSNQNQDSFSMNGVFQAQLNALEEHYQAVDSLLSSQQIDVLKGYPFLPSREIFLDQQKLLIATYKLDIEMIIADIEKLQQVSNQHELEKAIDAIMTLQNQVAVLNLKLNSAYMQYLNTSSRLYISELTLLVITILLIIFCVLLFFDRTRLKLYRFLVQRLTGKIDPNEKLPLSSSAEEGTANELDKIKQSINEQIEKAYFEAEIKRVTSISGSIEEIINTFYTISNKIVNYERASILFIDFLQDEVVLEYVKTNYQSVYLDVGYKEKVGDTSLRTIMHDKKLRNNEDIELITDLEDIFGLLELKKEGMRSNLVMPLLRGRTVFGFINLSSTRVNQFKEKEMNQLTEMVNWISVSIENQYFRRMVIYHLLDSTAELNHNQIRLSTLEQHAFNDLCFMLALKLSELDDETIGVTKEMAMEIGRYAKLIDIGEMYLPNELFDKKGKLTEMEYELIKQHVDLGMGHIKKVRTSLLPYPNQTLQIAEDMIHHHHERYDGTGYPDRLEGSEIPICAQIVGIMDVLTALISDRPYRRAYSLNEALAIINDLRGTQFNPVIVDVLNELIENLYP